MLFNVTAHESRNFLRDKKKFREASCSLYLLFGISCEIVVTARAIRSRFKNAISQASSGQSSCTATQNRKD